MVVGAFPIAKLGYLLMRQISKPIANVIKERAKSHPFFRHYICMPPAQFYHWCEVKTKMWVLNLGKPVNIPVLNEAMAIELGANLLGESIIFIIAAGVLISEYSRTSRKDAAKEKETQEKISKLVYTLEELYFQNERQDTQIKQLLRVVADLESYVTRKPNAPKVELIPVVEPSENLLPTIESLLTDGPKENQPDNAPTRVKYSRRREKQQTDEYECTCEECMCADDSGIVLKACQNVKTHLWHHNQSQRQEGIITMALIHLEENVLARSV